MEELSLWVASFFMAFVLLNNKKNQKSNLKWCEEEMSSLSQITASFETWPSEDNSNS